MKIIHGILPVLLSFLLTGAIWAQPVLDFQEVQLAGPALVDPVDIAAANDGSGRLFIVEKRGTVRIIENDTVRSSYFMDVRPLGILTTSEMGLLGLVFHPQYPSQPYVFVNYVKPGGSTGRYTRIARFQVNPSDPDDVLENTELTILDVEQPYENHNAGDLAFGPDGYLYITMGDGGSFGDPGENGQDLAEVLGKILRIDIDNGNPYSIPPDNPFVDSTGALDEIWAYGMRNPWRMSFDRETGDLWIADVGQGMWEEVDFQPAGSAGGVNYGWDCYEGDANYEGTGCGDQSEYQFPVFVYPHNCNQGCPYGTGNSITGGFVYRGQQFSNMQGYYICADYGSENIWIIGYDGENFQITSQSGVGMFNRLSTFGEDENGELYAASMDDEFLRVVPDGFLPVYLTHFTLEEQEGTVVLKWRMENMQDVSGFNIERSANGVYFKPIGTEDAMGEVSVYTYKDIPLEPALYYYRIVYRFHDGSSQISPIRSIDLRSWEGEVQLRTMANGNLGIVIPADEAATEVKLYTMDGRLIAVRSISSFGEITETAQLMPGVYVVTVETSLGLTSHKWVRE